MVTGDLEITCSFRLFQCCSYGAQRYLCTATPMQTSTVVRCDGEKQKLRSNTKLNQNLLSGNFHEIIDDNCDGQCKY